MKKPTRAERQRFDSFRHVGCAVCRNPNFEIHHIRHSGKKDHALTIPLCFPHHRNHGHGISVHDGLSSWVDRYGSEWELLERVNREIGI